MLNIFEQPWTMIGAAVLVLFGALTFRSVVPERRRPWQWLIPIAVAGLGFGLDALVETDLEEVNSRITTCLRALKAADCQAIAGTIAEDYSDSLHESKASLIAHCRRKLDKPIVERARITGSLIEMSPPRAKATIFAKINFTPDSYVAQNYRPWILIKVRIRFTRQADDSWLISRIDILEVDKQPFTWRGV